MNKFYILTKQLQLWLVLIITIQFISCDSKSRKDSEKNQNTQNVEIIQETKDYWFSGKAEITSYELTQQRYGEARKGKAVLIYVTEDFDHKKLVKTNHKEKNDYPVLKLNAVKNFTTGIYPYHIMQSTFLPIEKNQTAVKITTSIQEWCGQSYMQLEQREKQEIQVNSYFKQIGNYNTKLENFPTENALWSQLRLFPNEINTRVNKMIPSFEFLRLNNIEVDAYGIEINQNKNNGYIVTKLNYPKLNRRVEITQNAKMPYTIIGWKEIINKNDSIYVTSAKKMQQIKIDYWNKKLNQFSYLRDLLRL